MSVAVRPAQAGDLAAVRLIAAEHGILGPDWPAEGGPDFLDLEREAGTLAVALEDGVVVGFAGTLPRGGLVHLGDLFVTAAAQSAGHGRRLLAAVAPKPGVPWVTFASSDRRAQALYLRHGLVPGQPLWYLRSGPGTAAALLPAADLRRAGLDEAVALDATVSGGERGNHLAWYGALPGVRAWAAPGGYAFTRADGVACRIGPAGGSDAAAAARVVLGAARGALDAGMRVTLAAFGASPVTRALVEAGFQIYDQDLLMASRPGLFDPDRYLPSADLG